MSKNDYTTFPFLDDEQLNHTKKLFCFSFAGGSATKYYSWLNEIHNVAVIPIELPGKHARMKEPLELSLNHLIETLAREIANIICPSDKISLYGHSFGALLAFYVTHLLEIKYKKSVNNLIVAGRHSVTFEKERHYYSKQSDTALKKELLRQRATPIEILETKAFQDLFLPMIKNDYKLDEQHKYQGEIIKADIIAHVGDEDEDASQKDMLKWKEVTKGKFSLDLFHGSHFFPFDLSASYCRALDKIFYEEEED
ncbi:TPA: thioesterase [Staphylococcus aureus]|nr:thioesterase [Staphylococcus aureus]HDJ2900558.1 thioesterase [Staphylococcus aureus]HDJ2903111.1 thioesterase [Staphylococcus aureus]HDJ2939916.1 thioesterase [Staphylococcus aureus]HDJ2962229.1 thioesterase [Staphylococcus aureus]